MKIKFNQNEAEKICSIDLEGIARLRRSRKLLRNHKEVTEFKNKGLFNIYNRSEYWTEFTYKGERYGIWEPWGDSSDLMIVGLDKKGNHFEEIGKMFEAEKPTFWDLFPTFLAAAFLIYLVASKILSRFGFNFL